MSVSIHMTTRAAYGAAWIFALFSLVAGLVTYAQLPPSMMAHWNAVGEPDGYMPRILGVTFVPFLIALISSIALLIPRIDPVRANIEHFRREYNVFVFLIVALLAIVQLAVLAVNLGVQLSIGVIVMPAFGVLLFAVGILLPETKRHYFIGIRTPWTVANDTVWERTHRLGGTIFKILGVLSILSLLAPSYAMYLFFVPLLIAILGLVFYSYDVYQKIGTR